jgi:CheY-like chemotaxis protein
MITGRSWRLGRRLAGGCATRTPNVPISSSSTSGLPGMDGWQVLERLRDVSDVPVLLLTAHGPESDKVRDARQSGDVGRWRYVEQVAGDLMPVAL